METDSHEDVKEKLHGKFLSYVLVSCSDPNELGEIDVEMSYDGDPELVEYLLRDAYLKVHSDGTESMG